MSSLNTTITFKKMNQMSIFVPKNLNFNMLWIFNELFYKNRFIAKIAFRFTFHPGKIFFQLSRLIHASHSHPSATGCSFEQYWIADIFGFYQSLFCGSDRRRISRDERHPGIMSQLFCFDFVAHSIDAMGRRTNKNQIFFFDLSYESTVFTQKSITGMNSVCSACQRNIDYPIRSEEHTSELQSRGHLVCRLLLEK